MPEPKAIRCTVFPSSASPVSEDFRSHPETNGMNIKKLINIAIENIDLLVFMIIVYLTGLNG
jgi:hypothetical protein